MRINIKAIALRASLTLPLVFYFAAPRVIAQATTARFTLHIASPAPELTDGREAVLIIEMTNRWIHPLAYAENGPGHWLKLQVVDGHGNEVKETPLGMKKHGNGPASEERGYSIFTDLLPIGETLRRKIELGKEFDLSLPGAYTVTASRLDNLAHMTIVSNPVTITVLAK
jgi:hypothetical protein